MPSARQPALGDIVHYTSSRLGGDSKDGAKAIPFAWAAIITAVASRRTVDLLVFYPGRGQVDMDGVVQTDEPAGSEAARRMWAWPVKTDAEIGADDGEAETSDVTAADLADGDAILRAITVLFDNRRGRPKERTIADLQDIRVLVEEKLKALGRTPDA